MSWEAESRRRHDLERVAVATALRYPHLSTSAIARLFEASLTDVRRALSAAGIDRPARNAGDDLTPRSMADDVLAGLSVQAMARKYGVLESQIRKLMSREEESTVPEPEQPVAQSDQPVPKRRRIAARPPAESVAKLRAQGLTWRDVAAAVVCSVSTVYAIAAESGFKGHPDRAREWLEAHGELVQLLDQGVPAAPLEERDMWPDYDESEVRVIRRGLSGAEARRYIEGAAHVLADKMRYDVRIILREVVNARTTEG